LNNKNNISTTKKWFGDISYPNELKYKEFEQKLFTFPDKNFCFEV
jgi:hypothetical protein